MISIAMPADNAPSFSDYQATRHFGSLNGLRFLCIAAVLWHHGPVWTSLENAPRIATRGFVGVDFFFVLSGFLITTLLMREASERGRFSLRGFYWRRFLRIIPVYFLVVTAVATYYIGVKGETQYLSQLPFYYLFLANFLTTDIPLLSPMWSLAVEEQYYLVWPLLLMILPPGWLIPVLGFLVLLNVVAVIGWLTPLGIAAFEAGPLRFAMFNTTYAPILLGSVVAILLHRPASFAVLARFLSSAPACLLSFGTILALLQWLPADLQGWPNLALHIAMAIALITIVIREDNALRPVLALRPIARVGEISYGVYLYHLIGLHIANVGLGAAGLATQNWVVLLIYTGISIVIADISFRTFERFFLNMKTKGWGRVRP
ncbi:acyltransferase [Cognatiyoonia sp. IB215446]|uniref:acyltransferase family protein n=1 Tax=Cognatiyoonia sp. IB215446 TaxID=3097355 RepID=UPI002A14BB58|nr:acyltransferase [Cognatiyoonia sp. IB215446]MDX8349226.1 acyltransferase [Cognatiyoonia sp. IB215446]